MQRERKVQLLRQTFKQSGKNLGHDEIAFFCKNHGSNPNRVIGQLSVNLKTDKFHCWTCGLSGKNLLYLFEKNSPEWIEYRDELSGNKEVQEEKKFDVPALPKEFKSFSKVSRSLVYRAGMQYLNDRGLSQKEINLWKLGYCEDGDFRNRIIIPSFDELGFLNFFTGRALYDSMQRYKNGNFSKDIIFNDYMIDWRKPVTVTEGPFDAFKVGKNAIALQGSLLSTGTKLFSKLVLSGVEVYFAMDKDAYFKQLSIIETMISYGVVCKFINIGKFKDVGEMTHEKFLEAKAKARTIRNDIDVLKMRMCS